MRQIQQVLSKLRHAAWPLVHWLRANPLGPALTVCLAGLLPLFLLPYVTMWLFGAPKLILTEVLLGAPLVPYAVYRVHRVSWRLMAGLWGATYILAFIQTPVSIRTMTALAISGHMTVWFLWASLFTAVFALYSAAKTRPAPARKESIYDKMASDRGA